MSAGTQIDYEALAQQARSPKTGGGVDYEALANQARGSVPGMERLGGTPPEAGRTQWRAPLPSKPVPTHSTMERFGAAASATNPLAQPDWENSDKPPQPAMEAVKDLGRTVWPGFGNYGENHPVLNALHAVPLIGPQIAGLSHDVSEGEFPELLGHAAGLIQGVPKGPSVPARPGIVPEMPAPIARAAAGIGGAIEGGIKGGMAPTMHGRFGLPIPASVTGAIAGGSAGRAVLGPKAAVIGGAIGAAVPVVKGAVQGARAAYKAFVPEATAPRPPAAWEGMPEPMNPLPGDVEPIPGPLPSGRVGPRPEPVGNPSGQAPARNPVWQGANITEKSPATKPATALTPQWLTSEEIASTAKKLGVPESTVKAASSMSYDQLEGLANHYSKEYQSAIEAGKTLQEITDEGTQSLGGLYHNLSQRAARATAKPAAKVLPSGREVGGPENASGPRNPGKVEAFPEAPQPKRAAVDERNTVTSPEIAPETPVAGRRSEYHVANQSRLAGDVDAWLKRNGVSKAEAAKHTDAKWAEIQRDVRPGAKKPMDKETISLALERAATREARFGAPVKEAKSAAKSKGWTRGADGGVVKMARGGVVGAPPPVDIGQKIRDRGGVQEIESTPEYQGVGESIVKSSGKTGSAAPKLNVVDDPTAHVKEEQAFLRHPNLVKLKMMPSEHPLLKKLGIHISPGATVRHAPHKGGAWKVTPVDLDVGKLKPGIYYHSPAAPKPPKESKESGPEPMRSLPGE